MAGGFQDAVYTSAPLPGTVSSWADARNDWLADQVQDPRSYEAYGRWGGTVLWLDVSSRWL